MTLKKCWFLKIVAPENVDPPNVAPQKFEPAKIVTPENFGLLKFFDLIPKLLSPEKCGHPEKFNPYKLCSLKFCDPPKKCWYLKKISGQYVLSAIYSGHNVLPTINSGHHV
jgi:hypothetical protein